MRRGARRFPQRSGLDAYTAIQIADHSGQAGPDLAAGFAWAPIHQLAIGLRVEPWVAMIRGRFTAEQGATELWRPQPLGVRAVAGLEARF